MIRLGPRTVTLLTRQDGEVDFELNFQLDVQSMSEGDGLEACTVTISRDGETDTIRAYAQDQLQACHRLMMMASAYISQVAEVEHLRPRLGDLPGEVEGFALFRY